MMTFVFIGQLLFCNMLLVPSKIDIKLENNAEFSMSAKCPVHYLLSMKNLKQYENRNK